MLEAERAELAEQVAVLTSERDTLAGKAQQQAAVLAAKLEAAVDRASRAEARAELAEQQAAKAAQEIRQAQTERDDARKAASDAREQAARLAGRLEALQRQDKVAVKQEVRRCRKTGQLDKLRSTGQLRCETWA